MICENGDRFFFAEIPPLLMQKYDENLAWIYTDIWTEYSDTDTLLTDEYRGLGGI